MGSALLLFLKKINSRMKAWFYDESSPLDPREDHQFSPNQPVSEQVLESLGVFYQTFDVTSDDFISRVDQLCKEKDYKNRDEITISKEKLPNYEEKLKSFFTEHLHDDEEVRLILDGSGFFDVRDAMDRWIRIHCVQGDLIVLPAGIYHRFILDTKNYIKAMRIFKEDPKWTPINRSEEAEKNLNRLGYLEMVCKPFMK
jgi:1,2-dihydroxy-3-keto-5-methylthiopentene dioxygenase